MSEAPYEIVRTRPEYSEAVAQLHSVLTPERSAAASARFLDWKYHRNPYWPGGRIYLALHRGQPVGMRGFFGTLWEAGGRRILVPCAGDLVIAPAHRDRGVVTALMRTAMADLAAEGFTHLFNLSASEVTLLGALAMGFKAVAPVAEWGHAPEPAEQLLTRMRRAAPNRFAARLAVRRLRTIQAEDTARPETMAALVDRLGTDGRLRHRRDAAYLRWRYQNPLSRYRFFYRWSGLGRRLRGYLVLAETGGNPLMLMDWEAADEAVAGDLLDAALLSAGQTKPLWAWRFTLSAARGALLAERGFQPETSQTGIRNLGYQVLVKALAAPGEAARMLDGMPVFEPASWDYRMAYADSY